ncbi:MAG: Crp/Fnr family transcriptional regulator [Rhodobacterales bacterium]|nr:Crp/Fnr family transcriptional regulator [Puniceibacterium antarcticum]
MRNSTAAADHLWDEVSTGWLGERSGDFQSALRAEVQLQSYARGEFTYHIGDDPGGIYGLAEGSFGVYASSESAGIVLGHIYRPGAWFGQGPMTWGKPRYLSFRALEPSRVLSLSLQAVDRIRRRLPNAQREFMSLTEYNQETMSRTVSDLLIRRSDLRIASVLLRILDDRSASGKQTQRTRGQMTQTELSEMANVSRHTANSVLKRFEAEGWVEIGYSWIDLRDADALRTFARG